MSGRLSGGGAYVYEFFAADGTALYVGYTYNPTHRFQDHRRKDWWPQVDDVRLHYFDHWSDAQKAERARITELQPVHNVAFTKRWSQAPSAAA